LSDPEKGGLITPEISVDREDLESARKLAASLRAVVGTKVSREVAIAAALELAAAFSGESASSEAPLAAMGGSR
jgi:hypothetical protein